MATVSENIGQEEINKIRDIPMVFIVGCGRSGTTLLQTMINSHPRIVATPECVFIVLLYSRFGKIKSWKEKDILQFVDALYKLPFFALWLIKKEELTRNLLSVMKFADYPLVCKMVYYKMKQDKDEISVVVDKNPIYSLFIPELLKIYPGSKFIHIVREPKDTVSAHAGRFNMKNKFFLAWYWKDFNTSIEKAKKALPGSFFTIMYENFVRNTEQVMRELCKFLNVPFDAGIMQSGFPERLPMYKETERYERMKIIHKNLLSPVTDSNIGKWKKEMSERDVSITEAIDGEYALNKYGYAKENLHTIHIPFHQIWKSKVYYNIWKSFLKLRFSNYTFNTYYRKIKRERHAKRTNNVL